MRILALKTSGLVIPSIHASMVKAFRSLGVDVVDLPVPKGSGDLQSLESHARQGGYQALFTIDSGGDQEFISSLRDLQLTIQIPWIIWFVDDPEGYGFPGGYEPDWTIAFCWDKELVQEISYDSSMMRIPLIYLPLATEPEVFFPEESGGIFFPGGVFVGSTVHPNTFLEEAARDNPGFYDDLNLLWRIYREDFIQFPHSIAWIFLMMKTGQELHAIREHPLCRLWMRTAVHFLGRWRRREIVGRLIGRGGGVFGDREWAESVGDLYQGPIGYGADLRKVYNGSAFVLDIRQPQARTAMTQRIFDAGACGRPVLVEYSPELEFFFDQPDGPFSFASPEEAEEIRKYLFRFPGEARMKAEKTRKKVLSCHTYRHRAAEILQVFGHH
jgi:spore maturation protein CgeB